MELFTIALLSLAIYFIPTLIAYYRVHRNMVPIMLTTVFLGWTGIGWIGALIWASSDNTH